MQLQSIPKNQSVPGLQELFDQIEQWYLQATLSDTQQSLEIKMFATNRVVNQIDVSPSVTYRGKVVNNRRD